MAKTFHKTLAEIQEMHDRKGRDYGSQADPFANVRSSEDFGIPGWLGAVVRLNDKISRIKSFTKNGKLENEPLRDALIDLATYSAIALTLYDQGHETAYIVRPRPTLTMDDVPEMHRPRDGVNVTSTRYPG